MSPKGMHICQTPDCQKEAKLQCPTCVKLDIKGMYFCDQTCFKNSWSIHKYIHGKTKKDDYNPYPNYIYTGELRPARQTPRRTVPAHIPRPDYALDSIPHSEQSLRGSTSIRALNDEEIEDMRVACKLAREVLEEGVNVAAVGVTSDEVDRVIHEAAVERDCYPSPLNYYGFPKSCCTSINEVICHGIPDLRPLKDGDICNIDVTVFHRGYHGDLNETLFIGAVAEEKRKLVATTHDCLQKAIAAVRPGAKYRDMGAIIQRAAGSYGVVRTYCGHGIHELFHCTPSVPHYAKNKAIGIMKPGHTFTIEPMISEGTWRDEQWPDEWTAVTSDGRWSAQFEETLLVTDTGVEVMTRRRSGGGQPYFMDN